jgi:hypothetical protein
MSDLERILWTSATTVLGGVLVFVVGQLVSRFAIEPWYEQRKVIGAIAEALLDYAHMFADSGDKPHPDAPAAATRLRRLSSELLSKSFAIPGYPVLSVLRLAPSWARLTTAADGLRGLSNTLHGGAWERKLILASQVATSLHIDGINPESFGSEAVAGLRSVREPASDS